MIPHEESLKDVVLQEMIEERYNKKHIDAKIREAMAGNPHVVKAMADGVQMVQDWLQGSYYASKQKRIDQLKVLDIKELVEDLLVGVAYCLRPVLYTTATAQLAGRLQFDNKIGAITTVAELLAVLCCTDLFDIDKPTKMASLTLVSRIPLPDNLVDWIEGCEYLPPMLCQPLELTHNYSSGYLTHNDSLVLGPGNHHNGDLCLDVLNLMNSVPLTLNTEFLSQVEEEPSDLTIEGVKEKALKKGKFLTDLEAAEVVRLAVENWKHFKAQSYRFYTLMVQSGNRFYLTHKVDKRGRIYAQGYHISTQGAPFKKAMLEFAEKEIVDGCPG